ncbi:hypothetical protein GCM10008955_33230 [Deinococcus malanensis]|uniref:SRPBCC family protein n=1 Tax=Deinococcus malanensis TaxID=1706855 RepID=A0ABQ2F0C3_9DEIO|nr:SRPBCC family protein [Deinococcus malanensis]GGK36757.1 hypothetical protein GCM10008955_33230 [Deinococcus malanensis]
MSLSPLASATSMVRIKLHQDIQRPPQAVFDYACQPQHAPNWMRRVLEVNGIRRATFTHNGQFLLITNILGRRVDLRYRLSITEHPLSLRLFSLCKPVPHAWHYMFEAYGDGTRVTAVIEGWPESFSRLTTPLMVYGLHREMRAMLLALKDLLEIGVVTSRGKGVTFLLPGAAMDGSVVEGAALPYHTR